MRILALFLVTLLSFNVSACAKESTDDKILDIQEVSTKSGVTAWLVEDHSLPIISLKFSFRGAGSIQNSENKQGLARLLSNTCLLYTSPSPRDKRQSRMPSSA